MGGYVARMEHMRNAYTILFGNLMEQFERPRCISEDNIKMGLKGGI